MASLFLIRHCEPEITGVLLGQMDPRLSREGRIHAATALAGIQVEVVWTSPLRRARETADFINSHRLVEIPELREIDQGEWTGKTWAEVEANWSDLASRKSSDWLGVPPPGGETWTSLVQRVGRALSIIRAEPVHTAVIGHQGVNAALAYLIDGRNPLEFTQGYGEVIPLEYD